MPATASSTKSRFWRTLGWAVFALIAVTIGVVFSRLESTRDQNLLESAGATIESTDEGHPLSALLSGPVLTDTNLEHVGRLEPLRVLTLIDGDCSARGLESLQSLSQLKDLLLQDVQCAPGSLEAIGILPNLESLKIENCPWVGDDDLRAISRQTALKQLTLSGTSITDAGLVPLSSLKNLESLSLQNHPQLSLAGVVGFVGEINSEELNVRGDEIDIVFRRSGTAVRSARFNDCDIDIEALTLLAQMDPHVMSLSFGNTNLSDEYMPVIGKLEKLMSLSIHNPTGRVTASGFEALEQTPLNYLSVGPVDDRHLESIGQMRTLRMLNVSGPVTDAGLSHLGGLHNLTELYLSNSQVTGTTVGKFTGLKNLSTLDFNGSHINDAGLLNMADLSITRVNVRQSDVSAAGLQQFRKRRPDVWLSHDVDGIASELQPVPQSDLSAETAP